MFFLNVPGATFIQGATSIPDSRVRAFGTYKDMRVGPHPNLEDQGNELNNLGLQNLKWLTRDGTI